MLHVIISASECSLDAHVALELGVFGAAAGAQLREGIIDAMQAAYVRTYG